MSLSGIDMCTFAQVTRIMCSRGKHNGVPTYNCHLVGSKRVRDVSFTYMISRPNGKVDLGG